MDHSLSVYQLNFLHLGDAITFSCHPTLLCPALQLGLPPTAAADVVAIFTVTLPFFMALPSRQVVQGRTKVSLSKLEQCNKHIKCVHSAGHTHTLPPPHTSPTHTHCQGHPKFAADEILTWRSIIFGGSQAGNGTQKKMKGSVFGFINTLLFSERPLPACCLRRGQRKRSARC